MVHEDVFVVISRNGWLKRVKSYDPRTQLLKEGDTILAVIEVNTSETVAFFSNFGKVYVSRVYDLEVSGKGYGDPIQTIFHFQDQERIVAVLSAEPKAPLLSGEVTFENGAEVAMPHTRHGQLVFFPELADGEAAADDQKISAPLCLVATRQGRGFCFERAVIKEPTTRQGRTLIRLRSEDEVVGVRPVERPLLVIASSNRILVTPVEQVSVLAGTGQGVRLMNPDPPAVIDFTLADTRDTLVVLTTKGKEKEVAVSELPTYNRGAKGAVMRGGIQRFYLKPRETAAAGAGKEIATGSI
jgi:DNA gyrase subunit A